MSPELEQALQDETLKIALKRIYNFKRLRELNAPPVLIEQASVLLDKTKKALGTQKYNAVRDLFDEFRPIHEAYLKETEAMMEKPHDDV
jgi:hypothetical protein